MMKKRLIACTLLILLGSMWGCTIGGGKPMVKTGAPDYSDTNLEFEIGAWIAPKATDAAYKEYKEGGYNIVHLNNSNLNVVTASFDKDNENAKLDKNLQLAKDNDIRVILALSGANLNMDYATPFRYIESQLAPTLNKWKDSYTFYGISAYDEPNMTKPLNATGQYMQEAYDRVIDFIRDEYLHFSANYPGRLFETVLLRAPNDGETMRYGTDDYDSYLQMYIDEVLKYMPIDERVLSMDAYCFGKDRTGIYIRETFLDSLEKVSLKAEQYNARKMTYTMNHNYIYNTSSVLYNYYSSLAYGYTSFITFTYNYVNWGFDMSSIDIYGNKTDNYYYYQEAHEEVRSFENVYLNFSDNWRGVMAYAGSQRNTEHKLPWKNCTSLLQNDDVIKSVSNTQDLIIGAMKDKDGYDGYLISNQVLPTANTENDISITFANANRLLVYKDGKAAEIIELSDGKWDTVLRSGGGAFVIPFNEEI